MLIEHHWNDIQGLGLLDRASLANALENVDWLMELKDEEFSKFIQVALVVLCGLYLKAYTCFCFLSEKHNLVFSKRLWIEGWNEDHCTYFKPLLSSHAILYEELYSIKAWTENVEYSLHMPEDVNRHSTMDNYWCYLYEQLCTLPPPRRPRWQYPATCTQCGYTTCTRAVFASNHLVTEILIFRKCTLSVCLPDPHFRFAVRSGKRGMCASKKIYKQ